jgi:transcriptional regulator with XRE-family HTH domain
MKTMKQPDLGKKILELRKAKGLTQEELVDLCNISVRTIQRIETGEVTPRSYTVKTILSALDYDISKIQFEEEIPVNKNKDSNFENKFFVNADKKQNIINQLLLSCAFGIIYFVLGFFEGAADYLRFESDELLFGIKGYIILKGLVLISFLFFMRGFIIIGGLLNSYLLQIVASIMLVMGILILSYDIASVFYLSFERKYVLVGASITYGAIGIAFGITLVHLKDQLGSIATVAGIIEILAAVFFLFLVVPIGFFLLMPAELLEIIILFKVINMLKQEDKEKSIV